MLDVIFITLVVGIGGLFLANFFSYCVLKRFSQKRWTPFLFERITAAQLQQVMPEETEEDIDVRVYWEPRQWRDIGFAVNLAEGSIQVISNMNLLPKLDNAKYLIPKSYGNISNYHTMKFTRASVAYPQGFKQNPEKYAVTFWERNG